MIYRELRVAILSSAILLLGSVLVFSQDLISVSDAVTIQTARTVTTNKIISGGQQIASVDIESAPGEPIQRAIKLINIDSRAANVRVTIEDSERNSASEAFAKINDRQYASGRNGTYWFRVLAVDFERNIFDEETKKIVLDGGSTPDPSPDNAPIEEPGLRVMFIVESSDMPRMPADQQAILYSSTVRSYLSNNCVKVNGQPEWRVFDPDTVFPENCDLVWCKAIKRPRTSVPWVIISNGTTGFEGPLPANVADFMALVRNYQ